MQIYKKNNKYIVENFGIIETYKKVEILKCFLKKDDLLLFQYYIGNPDDLYPDTVEEEKENDYINYCDGILSFSNIQIKNETEKKIKDLLISTIDKEKLKKMDLNELNKLQEKLFASFCEGNQTDLDEGIRAQIKDIIHLNLYKDKDPDIINFIKERVIFVNSEWISTRQKPERWDKVSENASQLVWFSVKGEEEITKVINFDEYFFTCIVVGKNNKFNDYSYALINYESDVTFDLAIEEKVTSDFVEEVIPKIKRVIPEISLSL